jgi:hypothetical protein
MQAHIDSFSGACADLPPGRRSAGHVLTVLWKHPRVSCFDLTGKAWLRTVVSELVKRGSIEHDDSEPYPWVFYRVTPTGWREMYLARLVERGMARNDAEATFEAGRNDHDYTADPAQAADDELAEQSQS